VITFTVAGADAEARIRDGLARGADRAVRIDDPALAGSDSLGIARVLAAALRAEGVGLVLAGRQAVDGDSSTVPAMIAELMGTAQVSWVDKFDVEGSSFTAQRAAGGGMREVVTGNLPAVVSCDKGLNTPRYATLPGILKAKSKKIDVKDVAGLGLAADSVGAGAALVTFSNMGPPPERPAGRILSGDNAAAVAELVRLLRNEAKVI
jgi:electron transfer flavoprotein beta subunit